MSGKHHVSVGVAWIRFGLQRYQPRHSLTREATHRPDEVRHSLHGIDCRQQLQDWAYTESLDRILVHEAGVKVGDPSLVRARLTTFKCRDDVAYRRLSLIAQLHERAGQRLVSRDLGGLEPGPVHMTKKIILNADPWVEGGEVDRRALS